jgi:hypothetical protein
MNLPPILTPIAQGIDDGFWASVFGSAIKGSKGSFLQPLAQTFLQRPLLRAVSEALEAAGHKPVSSPLGWVLFLSPAVAYLSTSLLPEGTLSSALQGFQDQIGTLYTAAFVVSKIALVYFAPGPGAIASVVFIAAQRLDASGWITNKTISRIYSNALAITFIAAQALLVESVVGYVLLGMAVIAWLMPAPTEGSGGVVVVEPNPIGALTVDKKLTLFLSGNVRPKDFKINFAHIDESPLPPLPTNIEIDVLIKMWDKIDWSKHPELLNPSAAKANLQATIILAKKTSIYRFPHMDLRLIAERLSEQNEETRATTLWKLGNNFQANYPFVITNLVDTSGSVSFRKRVIRELEMLRGELSSNVSRQECKRYLPDFLTNQMFNCFASPFRAQPSNHPIVLQSHAMLRSAIPLEGTENCLIQGGYDISCMVTAISERTQVDTSFKEGMIQWWKTRSAHFSEEEQSEFNQFIKTHGEQGIFTTQHMILAMLYDFNIIRDKVVEKIEARPSPDSGSLGLGLQTKTNG